MKLFIMQLYPVFCYSLLFGRSIFLSTLFLNTISWCSFNVRDQVSEPYTTKGKIIVQYILIYILRQQTGRQDLGPSGTRHSVN